MISTFQHPHPHKNLVVDARSVHASRNPNTRANLRSHSLPTPAPSPAPSFSRTSASASSSNYPSPLVNMLSLGTPEGPFPQFARSFSSLVPAFPFQPSVRASRQYMPATPDASCLALPTYDSEEFEPFRAMKSRVLRLSDFPASPEASARALLSLFPLLFSHTTIGNTASGIVRPTPVRMWTLRPSAIEQDGERPVWAVFASHEEAFTALTLTAESGVGCPSINVMPALESELEPFAKLQTFTLDDMLNVDLNPTLSTQSSRMGLQAMMRYPPSPTSSNATDVETEAELFFPDARDDLDFIRGLNCGFNYSQTPGVSSRDRYIHTVDAFQSMQDCGLTLSSNPSSKTRMAFRHGDWICAVPACGAHNFGRNVSCIQCASPRSLNIPHHLGVSLAQSMCSNGMPNANTGSLNIPPQRNMSPRFATTANMQPRTQNLAHQQQRELLLKAQLQAQAHPQTHPLLTPSGRAFAVGGKVQNISPDPLAPCYMFWPDNEPFPEAGQIRPASLSSAPQPPIMNTGNKGPIERQPGDWNCQKCQYLNWRRRKVCQTCFPYAEGNGDSVSATMHAERLALLAAVYGQPQPQSQPQVTTSQLHVVQEFSGRPQANNDGPHRTPPSTASLQSQYLPTASKSPSLPNYPFNAQSSAPRSQIPSVPNVPLRRTPIPQLSISTSVTNSQNSAGMNQPMSAQRIPPPTEPQLGAGNIVYQTPPSPAAMRPPASISSPLAGDSASPQTALSAGPLLPSFLKQEVQHSRARPRPLMNPLSTASNGPRSPASLSPASSTSADLPFDEHVAPGKSAGVIGSGRSAAFYALPRGASSGSSMGSSSSLTLAGGGSIWSLEHNENKAWNNGVFNAAEALKGMTLS